MSVTAKVKSNQKFQNRRHLRSKLRNEALKLALSITDEKAPGILGTKSENMTSYYLLSAKGT